MRSALGFDPRQRDYGPATDAVRQLLLEWETVDWFGAGRADRDRACKLFLRYNQLGRAFAPELFARDVEPEFRAGEWSEFIAWCTRARIRATGWDWKYTVLKPLSAAHAKVCGWNLDEQQAREIGDGTPPGDLFVRVRGAERSFVIWCGVMPRLLELESRQGEPVAHAAEFYLSYAHDDLIHCIQWQLAKRSNNMDDNPFVPLLECYRIGFYPFMMNPDSVLLFRFQSDGLPERRTG